MQGLSLLERVKNKAVDAFSGIGQTVSNVANNIWTGHSPLNPSQPSLQDVFNPGTNIEQGQANLNAFADMFLRPIPRLGFEGAQTIAGDNNAYTPEPGLEQTIFGKSPLRNFNDLNRPAGEFAQKIGQPGLQLPLVALGGAIDVLPVNPAKLLEKGGVKEGAKIVEEAAKPTADLFAKASEAGNIFKKKGTPKKLFEDLFRSSKGVIERSGPAGKEIVRRLNVAEKEGGDLAGEATARMEEALNALNPDEINSFADVVEGVAKPLSEAQVNAVKAWQEIAGDVATKAKESGIDMGIRENYFPHQISELSDADKTLMVQDMVKSGKFTTEAEALQSLEKEIGSIGRTSERRYGNLELPRETDLPYNKSPNVLFDYIKNAYGRVTDAKHLGTSDEQIYKLAKAAGTQGGDTNQIVKYVDQILGKNQNSSKLAEKLTSFQTITKLSPVTSAINLTQNLSTWLRTDTESMAKAVGRVISDPKTAFANATKVGEISPDMFKALEDYAGTGDAAGKWIRLIGMQGTEKMNRVLSVNAGIEYASKLAQQAEAGSGAAIRELERLGIKASEVVDGKLSDKALKTVGKAVSGETQFSTKAGELPYFWRTNVGKVITQFKSFAYKQTKFTGQDLKRTGQELKEGNVKPLINALVVNGIAAPLAGEIVNDFKSLIRNKKREDTGSLTERYVSNILAARSFGLLDSDTLKGAFGGYGEGGVVSTFGGPTGGDIFKAGTAIKDTVGGVLNYDPAKSLNENIDPANTTKRNLIKEIPAIGQTISNTLVSNQYVNNVFGGVNNGLNKDNNATYNAIKETDPQAAEEFKKNNQQTNAIDQGGNSLKNLFTGKTPSFAQETPKTPEAKKANDAMVKKALEAGATIPDKALSVSLFEGKSYDKNNIKDRTAILKKLGSLEKDEFLTEDQKAKILEVSGVPPKDYEYYKMATMSEDERLQGVLSFAQANQEDRGALIQALALNKREIGGQAVSNSKILDRLYDEGLISKEEKALVTAIKFDPIYNKFYMDRDYKGAGGGSSASKTKAAISKLNSIYKVNVGDYKTTKLKSTDTESVKLPSAPKLNLSTRKAAGKSANQWFTPY